MTLRALINSSEPGRICEVRPIGEEFEVHPAFYWVDVPDGTTSHDTYNGDGTITKFDILQVPGFVENAYKVARTIAYTGIGEQLDMLYKELQTTGTISNSGPWASHITSVKEAIPKDDPLAVHEWNIQHLASMSGNI
jgi:NADH:ubiquinone oxidoreductase subunit